MLVQESLIYPPGREREGHICMLWLSKENSWSETAQVFPLNWYFIISKRKSLSWNSSVKESRAKEMFTMRRSFRRINRRKFVVRVLVLIIASTFFIGNFIQYGRTRQQQHMQPQRESKTEKCDCKIGKWLWILDIKEIHGSNKRMTSAVQWNPRSNQDFHDLFTATKRKLVSNSVKLSKYRATSVGNFKWTDRQTWCIVYRQWIRQSRSKSESENTRPYCLIIVCPAYHEFVDESTLPDYGWMIHDIKQISVIRKLHSLSESVTISSQPHTTLCI